jgi:hypothetical protein
VTINVRSSPTSSFARRTAAASSDSGPPNASSCLGRARRLDGQSRVPDPPPRMTAKAGFEVAAAAEGCEGAAPESCEGCDVFDVCCFVMSGGL